MNATHYTLPEINYILENANFSKRERKLFELRNEEYSVEECAEIMNLSRRAVSNIRSEVKRKIAKIMPEHG